MIILPEVWQGRYVEHNKIGSGSYGLVYRLALSDPPVTVYALKVVPRPRWYQPAACASSDSSDDTDNRTSDDLREIDLLRGLDHVNIIKLLEYDITRYRLCMVLEFMPGGDLQHLIDEYLIPEPGAKFIFSQLMRGVQYLHQRNIVHRDIKVALPYVTLLYSAGNRYNDEL